MIKNILLTLTMMLAFAAPASAQAPGGLLPPEVLQQLAQEPALTQKDVNAFIKMLPHLSKIMTDQEAITKLYEKEKLTATRFTLLVNKIPIAMALVDGMPEDEIGLAKIPEELKPTKAEQELIKKNMTKLQKGLDDMINNIPDPGSD